MTGQIKPTFTRDAGMAAQTAICHSCQSGCCRSYAVPITGADVLRLERATGLNFWGIACRWEDADGIICGDYVPNLYFDDEPLTPFTLCLLHEPSVNAPGTTKCRFLHESPPTDQSPIGAARCLTYGTRPSACRVFPLKMHTSSLLAVLSDVPEHGRPADGHPAYQLCPRPWEPSDIDPITAPQDLAVAEYEAAFFRQVAALWNEQPGSWLKFPEFLHLVYENRVVRPTSVAEPAEPATLPFPSAVEPSRRVA